MDYPNGAVFYDMNCNVIASFVMGRCASAFVEDGYTAGELGKADYLNIRCGLEMPEIPIDIKKALTNTDSLQQSGPLRVLQVRIKKQILYHFEQATDKEKVNCKDCYRPLKYYDEDFNLAVTFIVGGIGGLKATNNFTASDFHFKQTLRILWNK